MTLGELKGLVTLTPAGKADDAMPTLELPPELSADQVLVSLAAYFGEDDSRDRVAILASGIHAGTLTRQALYAVLKPAQRGVGVGGGAHGSLPGRGGFRLIRLVCSMAGCGEERLVMTYDEDEPPRCRRHPAAKMWPAV